LPPALALAQARPALLLAVPQLLLPVLAPHWMELEFDFA